MGCYCHCYCISTPPHTYTHKPAPPPPHTHTHTPFTLYHHTPAHARTPACTGMHSITCSRSDIMCQSHQLSDLHVDLSQKTPSPPPPCRLWAVRTAGPVPHSCVKSQQGHPLLRGPRNNEAAAGGPPPPYFLLTRGHVMHACFLIMGGGWAGHCMLRHYCTTVLLYYCTTVRYL